MKFNKSSQLMLVSAASLLVAGLVTACSTLTVDFVFVTSSKAAGANNNGEVDVFEINQQSGFMRQIPTSPFPSGGRDPVAEAISADQTNLYVVNQDDNSIVQFVIGNDGKIYPQNTVNTPGIYPLAVAINGTNLFVVDTYQPLPICSTAEPCSGSIGVLPITVGSGSPPSDTLGTPVSNGSLSYWPLCQYGYISATDFTQCQTGPTSDVITPTGVNVLKSGSDVYVTAYDSSVTPSVGYVFGFSVGTGGALVPLNGGVPFLAGVHPSAIASDSTSTYVYVTDMTSGQVLGFAVSSGVLTPLSSGANGTNQFPAGNQPSAIAADPQYPFIYVTNKQDSTVSAYSMSSGTLTSLGTYATGLEPVAIGIDPSTNHFLYTANYLSNGVSGSVSGFELSTTAGTLLNSQNSPYNANAQPTAVAAIPHGSSSSSSSSK
ncbi:MAG: lactonase family protein [Terracidiphilus sp.]